MSDNFVDETIVGLTYHRYPTISVDSTNTAYVFCQTAPASYLTYLTGSYNNWGDPITTNLYAKFITSAIDSTGGLHIAYFDAHYQYKDLRYIYLPGANQSVGSLTVNISPASAVTAGAQWRVDSGTWN
ncbi:hypothetical protein MTBBW1_1230001 [Desulfamplus magnetovallimortis]|uniref:Uncharacterized protein n=2 Tax=Desulfamplus magnetovallimortis TaxID=1246637 RepID=A0A1W1H6B0_9BACT|nr:hypothetical protein MTBBW1_1230001 [Desulfamplus magnetovallimortis]